MLVLLTVFFDFFSSNSQNFSIPRIREIDRQNHHKKTAEVVCGIKHLKGLHIKMHTFRDLYLEKSNKWNFIVDAKPSLEVLLQGKLWGWCLVREYRFGVSGATMQIWGWTAVSLHNMSEAWFIFRPPLPPSTCNYTELARFYESIPTWEISF